MVKNGRSNGAAPNLRAEYIGRHGLLLQGDCLQLLAKMKEGTVDLAFADPPFNLNKTYEIRDFNDNMETEAYRTWCRAWLLGMTRVLKPGGALFLYHWPKWLVDLGSWLNGVPALEYRSWIALKMKSGFPIRGRLHPAHYGLLHYTKKGAKPKFHVVRARSPKCRHCGKLIRDYGGYRKKYSKYEDEGDIWIQISDFWEDSRPASHEKLRRTKLNELPLLVPERAILLATNPGDVVLDCFAGGGSTLHAAEQLGRNWIGIDIASCKSTLRRIKTFMDPHEKVMPPKGIQACFESDFVRSVLKIDPESPTRPINRVRRMDSSAEKFKSKSRIFELKAVGDAAHPKGPGNRLCKQPPLRAITASANSKR